MNGQNSHISIEGVKKTLLIATIALVTICAFLGILMIFVGSDLTLQRVLWTLMIMYLVLVYSTKNFAQVEHHLPLVRGLTIAALIANFLWSLPWIMQVWDLFEGFGYYAVESVWKFIGSAVIVSLFCSVMASSVIKMEGFPKVVKVFKSLPIVCAAFLGIDLLIVIWWADFVDLELVWKLFLTELVLVLLQWIITQILMKNSEKLGIDIGKKETSQKSLPEQMRSALNIPHSDPSGQSSAQENMQDTSKVVHVEEAVVEETDGVDTATTQDSSHEAALRAKIEREVRERIAAEQAAARQEQGLDSSSKA